MANEDAAAASRDTETVRVETASPSDAVLTLVALQVAAQRHWERRTDLLKVALGKQQDTYAAITFLAIVVPAIGRPRAARPAGEARAAADQRRHGRLIAINLMGGVLLATVAGPEEAHCSRSRRREAGDP